MLESKGVLIATGSKGIMRSTDNGKHWEWVIKEDHAWCQYFIYKVYIFIYNPNSLCWWISK
jgi:hypothetical protein